MLNKNCLETKKKKTETNHVENHIEHPPSPLKRKSLQKATRFASLGIGKTLMGTAELIAAAHGFDQIAVIAGVGDGGRERRGIGGGKDFLVFFCL